jgi:VanZ family protein
MIIISIQSNSTALIDNGEFYNLQLDKLMHILAWSGLSFSLRLGLNQWILNYPREKNVQIHVLLILFCVFFGIFDELHQYFVPTRTFDLFDILADSIGSLIGIIVAKVLIN